MKQIFKIAFIILVLTVFSCAPKPKPEKIMPKPAPSEITKVNVNPRRFNPSNGERVIISFQISRPAKAFVKIFDPEMRLIKDLPCMYKNLGVYRVIWDGKDLFGNIVPDEAYFFTIETVDQNGNFTFYDPTTFSGREWFSPKIKFDPLNKKVTYYLAKDAWIRIRAGISGGPLLKTIINWVPRFAGKNEEIWDGKDESDTINVMNQRGFKLIAEAITLPENWILAYGNSNYNYFEYKTKIVPERPRKKERPSLKSKRTLMGSQWRSSKEVGPEPKFCIYLLKDTKKDKNGLPVIKGKTVLKIALDEKVKKIVTEQRYEIIFFVDFKFITEEESGYSPYTWVWDTTSINNGEHIITVNVCTLKGAVASNSLKVLVQN